jgi:hypothetical protein
LLESPSTDFGSKVLIADAQENFEKCADREMKVDPLRDDDEDPISHGPTSSSSPPELDVITTTDNNDIFREVGDGD